MPKLQEGEVIKDERLKNGVYYRITVLDGKTYQAGFDFKTKKSRRFKTASGEHPSDFMEIQLSE